MALNRDGDRTKFGSEWDARGVKRIWVNPLYSGILVNNKCEIEDFLTGRQVSIPEEERLYHERPDWAIVSPERFRRAQEITRWYRSEIRRFLDLETVTNADMHRLIDHITVSRDGNVHVVLRKFEEMP